MTYQILGRYFSITEQRYDKDTGKLISSVLSIPTLINQEVLISTITYSSASPVECRVTRYRLSHDKKE